MHERADFIRAIALAGDDHTSRLVFADWLDEHDQPCQAEFIRVQCELAEVGEPRRLVQAMVRGLHDGIRAGLMDLPSPPLVIGERVDVDGFLMRGRSDERLLGVVVVEELDNSVYRVVRDKKSGPFKQDRYKQLKERESCLLTRQELEWAKQCHSAFDALWPSCIEKWEYRLGLVDSLTATAVGWMEYADRILQAHPVLKVKLRLVPDDEIWAQVGYKQLLKNRWPTVKEWDVPDGMLLGRPVYLTNELRGGSTRRLAAPLNLEF